MSYPFDTRGVPLVTHTWLAPVLKHLGQAVTVVRSPAGAPQVARLGGQMPDAQVGNQTGMVGFYGATGIPQAPTGLGSTAGFTGFSGTANIRSNGGTGAQFFTLSDLVLIFKQLNLVAT